MAFVIRHFWSRWSDEYLSTLNKYGKWHLPVKNITISDIVVVREDGTVPSFWPLAKVTQTYPGKDGLVRIVDVKTSKGIYKHPVTKVIPSTNLSD